MKLCGHIIYYSFINSTQDIINDLLRDVKECIENQIVRELILESSDKFRHILEDVNLDETKLTNFDKVGFSNVFYNNFIPAILMVITAALFGYIPVNQNMRVAA